MQQKQDRDNNLAIVKYFDTSTCEGLKSQLLDSMQETKKIINDALFSLAEPISQLRKTLIQKERGDYLLNSGDLTYLEKQEDIKKALKDLARDLYPAKCIKENEALLDGFKKQWGNIIGIKLQYCFEVKKSARKNSFLVPDDTIQYQLLTCEDLFENFKFIEKVDVPKNQYIPYHETQELKIIRMLNALNALSKEELKYKQSYIYQLESCIVKYPVTFITIYVFFSLLLGLTAGYTADYVLSENRVSL